MIMINMYLVQFLVTKRTASSYQNDFIYAKCAMRDSFHFQLMEGCKLQNIQ